MTSQDEHVVRSAEGASGRSAYSGKSARRGATGKPFRGPGPTGAKPGSGRRWRRPVQRRVAALRRRRLLRGLVALAVAALAVLRLTLPPGSVVVRPKREAPRDGVFFYQADEAWGGDALGDSGRTLDEWGDEVCALASMLAIHDLPVPFSGPLDPGTLNAWLSENGAYDDMGGLNWNRAAYLLGLELTEVSLSSRTAALLDALVDREWDAVVRVKRPDNGRLHTVLLVGSNHGRFTIVDSLDPSGTLNRLDLYKNRIYSMLYMLPSGAESEDL